MKKMLVFILMLTLIGCAQQGVQPKDWYNFDGMKTQMKDNSFRQPIDDAVAKGDLVQAAILRNIQISKVVSGLNAFYGDYRTKTLMGNASVNMAVDVAQMSISALGTYFTNANILGWLARSSVVLSGSYTAYQKNFLQGQGVIVLVERMETMRDAQLQLISERKQLSYDLWTFDDAMSDCSKLFDDSTILGAILSINKAN